MQFVSLEISVTGALLRRKGAINPSNKSGDEVLNKSSVLFSTNLLDAPQKKEKRKQTEGDGNNEFSCVFVRVCAWPHLVGIDPVTVLGCQVGFHSLQEKTDRKRRGEGAQ